MALEETPGLRIELSDLKYTCFHVNLGLFQEFWTCSGQKLTPLLYLQSLGYDPLTCVASPQVKTLREVWQVSRNKIAKALSAQYLLYRARLQDVAQEMEGN